MLYDREMEYCQTMAAYANAYAKQHSTRHAFRKWRDITANEYVIYMFVRALMAIDPKPTRAAHFHPITGNKLIIPLMTLPMFTRIYLATCMYDVWTDWTDEDGTTYKADGMFRKFVTAAIKFYFMS